MNDIEWVAGQFGVLDYVPLGVFVVRPDWTVLFWNACLEEWTGISRHEMVGTCLAERFPHLADPKYSSRLRSIFEGGPPTIFSSQLHTCIIPAPLPDGQLRIQRTTVMAVPARDGQAWYALFSLQDVTDLTRRIQAYRTMRDQALAEVAVRKRAEEALRHSQETLRQRNRDLALLNQLGQELTATLDLRRVIEQLLQAITEIVNAQDASVWLWDKAQPGCLVCQTILRAQKDGALALRLEPGQGVAGWVAHSGQAAIVANARQDARFFPGIDERIDFYTRSLLAVPLRVRGKVIGVLEVVNKLRGDFDQDDLALVKTLAVSAAIALHNAELVEALRLQADELRGRNEELDAFAQTVAHDLQNPLSVIVGFAHALEEDEAALHAEDLKRYLHTIACSGRKMGNIIDELLLLASVRQEAVETSRLDMASIVAEALARLTDLVRERQAEIVLPAAWPPALGYAPWVEEVWVNYLSNAIKYGGQPPRLELGFDSGQCLVDSGRQMADLPSLDFAHAPAGSPDPAADGGFATEGSPPRATAENRLSTRHLPLVRFWVRDNGPGLAAEEQARLFTPFTRLDQVRARGHGLGLSIVRRIVDKLGGQVGVDSQPGCGSTFWFTLPADTLGAQQAAPGPLR